METQKFTSKYSCSLYTFVWLIAMILFAYLPILVSIDIKNFDLSGFVNEYNRQQGNGLGVAANIGFVFFVAWDYYLMCKDTLPKRFYLLSIVAVVMIFLIQYYASIPTTADSTMYDFVCWRIPFCPAYIFHCILLIVIFSIKLETVINTNLN